MRLEPFQRDAAVKNHRPADGFQIVGHAQQGGGESESGVGRFALGVGEVGDRVKGPVGVIVAVDENKTHGLAG
jgi:hypothetical protein